MTKERPILFNAPMVRAILAGRKRQTRRVVKPQPSPGLLSDYAEIREKRGSMRTDAQMLSDCLPCPFGQPGEKLWVRETFGHFERNDTLKPGNKIYYRADGECLELEPWRPSIHMPRWASRIALEITSVRVERLQDISEADAIAEGTPGGHGAIQGYGYNASPCEHYRALWESINGPGSWDANPWVWVIEFKRMEAKR